MEPKQYQKGVLTDLSRYLSLLSETGNMGTAYERLWIEKGLSVGRDGMPSFRTLLPGVPSVCIKVPTGGGKTFLASCAIKPVFDSMPAMRTRAVVWLVPSDSILEQTRKALMNSQHPYRQRIDVDFSGHVEVYDKSQLLGGQNFTPSAVADQLSIFILSYDSFRASRKDGRKAYQENANLLPFVRYRTDASTLLPDLDETALIQVVRSFNPMVVVDESHHATSELSLEMLGNFNPCFILELTATPHRNSNIISFVDAIQLKHENMIKLPVIVYNRKTQEDVFGDAIHLRDRLEAEAQREHAETGRYIRPIVLFQAQPRTGEESTTFDKIKKTLIACDIPEEQIAIRTSDINELRNVELASERCPIRYIITVNALREGWDCPFAYVLATIANRNSSVDVEQILGRVLRLPYARKSRSNVLNISYVLTSSNDFHKTLEKVVAGLNQAGFSRHDMIVRDHAGSEPSTQSPAARGLQTSEGQVTLEESLVQEAEGSGDFLPGVDPGVIRQRREGALLVDGPPADATTGHNHSETDQPLSKRETPPEDSGDLLASALQINAAYEQEVAAAIDAGSSKIPVELRDKMEHYRMYREHEEDASHVRLPQFMLAVEPTLFSDATYSPLQKEHLAKGFTLQDKDLQIDFSTMAAEMARVDVESPSDAQPKAWKLNGSDNAWFKDWFASLPSAQRLSHCRQMIHKQLSNLDAVEDEALQNYADRIIGTLSSDQLADLERSPHAFGERIKKKVQTLLALHAANVFDLWVEQGLIVCQPSYALPQRISPTSHISTIPKALYEAEESMNSLEQDTVWSLSAMDNIVWWHRNPSRLGFCINGDVHAYPDIMARTTSGKILLIETKGDHLDNPESEAKSRIGAKWAQVAGRDYRYFMVFDRKSPGWPGAYSRERFMEIATGL